MSEREKQKAIRMLEMLRLRTEARGATPAEAQQAAKFAERIIKRFGLRGDESVQAEARIEPGTNKVEDWAFVLSWAIHERFNIEAFRSERVGRRAVVMFRGPEHVVSVAKWLFMAIATDLNKRSHIAGRGEGLTGAKFRVFRQQFRAAAAHEIRRRLVPVEPNPELKLTDADRERHKRNAKRLADRERKRINSLTPEQIRREIERIEKRHAASTLGAACGKELSLDTNAVGGKEASRLEHQSSEASA